MAPGPATKEERDYLAFPPDRQANVDVVGTAFAAVPGPKSYLTMPVTTGRRFYAVLEAHDVRSLDHLLRVAPAALREEIILPNIAGSVEAARGISARSAYPLVVPGVFEGRAQRWSQSEYMCLWMRLITREIREVHLLDGWEYSNGGAQEYARAILLRHACLDARREPMSVLDERGEPVPMERGAGMLADAVLDLRQRGFDAPDLVRELSRLGGFAAMLAWGDRHEWGRHVGPVGHLDAWAVVDACRSGGAVPHYSLH